MTTSSLLFRTLVALLSVGMMTISTVAHAEPRDTADLPEPYKIPTPNPSTIENIRDVTGDGDPGAWEGEIHQDLSERAVCGGWDMNDTVNGKIPTVIGAPGRRGFPFGNIFSGMAYRDESSGALSDGYLYPDVNLVQGWSTACRPGFPPYLDDEPPCKDARNKNYATPAKCQNLCPRINSWQFPVWVRVWARFGPDGSVLDTQVCVQLGNDEKDLSSSPQDGDCCERNGSGDGGPSCAGKYESDADDPLYDPYPGTMPPESECLKFGESLEAAGYVLVYHSFAGWYYCCTGAIVQELNYGDCTLDNPEECASHLDARRNCVRCEGDGLPTGQLLPGAGNSCLAASDCPNPLICKNLVPEESTETPCVNATDCEIAEPCNTPSCRPWECINSKCTRPAIPGTCALASGANAAIDFNGDLIPRGSAPLSRETGCRAGYGASINGSTMAPGQFVSYYREYTTSYERNVVDEASSDIRMRQGIPVSCYGFYEEFDAKNKITSVRDARCVIAAYQPSNEFRRFYQTQLGHGSFGETSTYPDPDPTDEAEIRDPDFDDTEDLWYRNLGGGFSLLNGGVFRDQAEQDMTYALLNLDTTLERARGPLLSGPRSVSSVSSGYSPDPYQSWRSPGALRRAFDDTVSNDRGPERTITEWWQKQETEGLDLVHPAIAHIIFPSAWSVGINLEHYFPSPTIPPPPPSSGSFTSSSMSQAPRGSYDPRRMTIEVQTELRDDLLGEIAAFLEDALIAPVKERSIALIVPFGSATDFRAYKEGWIRWKELRQYYGETVPGSVDNLIDRLEEYAVQIDQARALRAELAKSLSTALKRQGDAERTIHDWLKANLDAYRNFQQQRQQREQLVYRWRVIQSAYRDFHDKTNMPWCKNDAFTTSIYSFLDNWLPGRPGLTGQGLPDLAVNRPEDLFIDLSVLQTTQTPLLVPVLKPIQILVSHKKLRPPYALGAEAPEIPELPPLPPLPVFQNGDAQIPAFSAGAGISITFPDVTVPPDIPGALSQMESIVHQMNGKYAQFWGAVTKPRCGTLEAAKRCSGADSAAGDCCVVPGEEKYCRRGWSSDTCVHVEMDLLERFTRIGARPAVQLFEDFLAMGAWRTSGSPSAAFPSCDARDWACLQLHATRVLPRIGWYAESNVRSQENLIQGLRARMFKETLQMTGSSSSRFPYQAQPDTIIPSFDVRRPVEITPATASASAAASISSSSSTPIAIGL